MSQPQPETFAVRTTGGRSARLIAGGLAIVSVAIVGLGWSGAADGPSRTGSATSAAIGSAPPASAPESTTAIDRSGTTAADRAVVLGTRVDDVDVTDPLPGTSLPGTGLIGVSGRVLTYRPDRVVARLRIAGRSDVVGAMRSEPAGAFSGWLRVAAPVRTTDAVLELYDGGAQLAPKRPLASIPFRLDPAPPVTMDRPGVPFEVIRTRDLVVSGTADPAVGSILVTLEARNNRVIERVIVSTRAGTGGPGVAPAAGAPRAPWTVRLALPAPHPNGTMVVEVAPMNGVADPDRYRLRLPVEIGALTP